MCDCGRPLGGRCWANVGDCCRLCSRSAFFLIFSPSFAGWYPDGRIMLYAENGGLGTLPTNEMSPCFSDSGSTRTGWMPSQDGRIMEDPAPALKLVDGKFSFTHLSSSNVETWRESLSSRRRNPSHASIPPYQNGTMAKDAWWVRKVFWRRERAHDKTGKRELYLWCVHQVHL